MKLGGNPFRTILHISFFEADFWGVADGRTSAYPRSGLLGGDPVGGVAPPPRNLGVDVDEYEVKFPGRLLC